MTPQLARATLVVLNPQSNQPEESSRVEAQFNPQSLQISYGFTGPRGSQGADGKAAEGSAARQTHQKTDYNVNLSSLSLFFDTTENGENVQNITAKIAAMLMKTDQKASPKVRFQWGKFLFNGTISSMQETLDYFSPDGTPLRATVALSMSMVQDRTANDSSGGSGIAFGASLGVNASASLSAGVNASAGLSASANVNFGAAVGTTPLTLAASGDSIQNISMRAGADWKAVASANGIDNPRKLQAGAVLNLNVKGGT
jgi:hypothetical protein